MKPLFILSIIAIILWPHTPVAIEVEGAAKHSEAGVDTVPPTPVASEEAKVKVASVKVATVDWSTFIEAAKPIAQKYDIPLKVMVSQAALETGHGTSWQARAKNNYFGLGAYNDNTSFGYSSVEECIEYYAKLISGNKRYSKAYEARSNPEKMIAEIKRAGYASDPAYVEKVTSLAIWRNL